MRKKAKIFRGLSSLTALLCALLIGVYGIASSADYKGMVDSMLGGSSAKASSQSAYAFTSEYDSLEDMLTERVRIAEQLAEEGCVLLKNDGALPLGDTNGAAGKAVTVLGNRPYTYKTDGKLRDARLTFYGGITGSVIYSQTVTIKNEQGQSVKIDSPVTLEDAFNNEGIKMNPALKAYYSNQEYSPYPEGSEAADAAGGAYAIKEPKVTYADANPAGYTDACFVVIGRTSGEGRDYLPGASGVKNDGAENSGQLSAIGLSNEERDLITLANQISPGHVIVLINSAVAMEIGDLKDNQAVNAVLWIGLPGSYGLNGVARVISGKASPSGHLSDTFATNASLLPAAQNFGDGDPDGSAKFSWSNGSYTRPSNGHYVVMAENVYTGYYYYETRYNDCVLDGLGGQTSNAACGKGASDGVTWNYANEVAYPFGYGLSYTNFTQKILPDSFTYNDKYKTVSLDVEIDNVGNYPSKSVAMLFVQTPYTDYDREKGIEKSAIQLVAFEKTDVIAPDDAPVTVTLTASIKYFTSYDQTYQHGGVTGSYIFEAGDYYFAIGNGAHEALNNVLAAGKGIDESKLYSLPGSTINANGVYKWNAAAQRATRAGVDVGAFDFQSGIDGATFSMSQNGTVIENQMQDANYNYFSGENTVTYLSRADWDTTFPKSYTKLATYPSMDKYLKENAIVYEYGNTGTLNANVQFGIDHSEDEDEEGEPLENTDIASYKGKTFDDEAWDYLLQQITFEEARVFCPLGGTSCNPFSSVNAPEVWQIDGPNGNVNRGYNVNAPKNGYLGVSSSDPNGGYKSADMPCAPTIASTFNKKLLEEEGKIFGEDILWSRNPIMWAPAMNLHRTPFNSRNHEYYSEDPMLTNLLGTSFVRGGVSKGAILAAKHFAFNTQESYREGLCQFFCEQSGREMELRAFQGLCEDLRFVNADGNEVNALGLMSTFSRVGVCGANAHTGMMKNILRKEWGFKGLISTDMVSRTGFFNPVDCVVNNVTFMATSSGESFMNSAAWASYSNTGAMKADPTFMNALYDNMHYYMYTLANSSALNGYESGDVIADSTSWWQIALIVISSVLGAVAVGFAGVTVYLSLKKQTPALVEGEEQPKLSEPPEEAPPITQSPPEEGAQEPTGNANEGGDEQ